jgi:IclR family acetate operon transcriptional repressor
VRTPDGPAGDQKQDAKSVLSRALRIFDTFDDNHSELRLSDIARRAELPLSTVHRLVGELVAWGGLERTRDHYRVGLRIFELGTIAPSWEQRRNAALPYMQDLYEATHESVHLGVLDGPDIVYLLKISGHQSRVPTRTGGRRPAHCTSLGKAILAFSSRAVQDDLVEKGLEAQTERSIIRPSAFYEDLALVRERGVAYDNQESVPGLACVAAPILDRDALPVAAVSVSGPHVRVNTQALAPALRAAALAISRNLANASPTRTAR